MTACQNGPHASIVKVNELMATKILIMLMIRLLLTVGAIAQTLFKRCIGENFVVIGPGIIGLLVIQIKREWMQRMRN